MESTLHSYIEDGQRLPLRVWQFDAAMTVASTASVGGGLGARRWVINAQVPHDYGRRDQDQHGAELAAAAGLDDRGVVMFTAADVRNCRRVEAAGICVEATVGLTHPTWAADADDETEAGHAPGTINIVAILPVRLASAALLNALCTVTEAKTQALLSAGVSGTGTPSDAVTVVCPATGPAEPFAGPRSPWGAPLARAVHDAVVAGASP